MLLSANKSYDQRASRISIPNDTDYDNLLVVESGYFGCISWDILLVVLVVVLAKVGFRVYTIIDTTVDTLPAVLLPG